MKMKQVTRLFAAILGFSLIANIIPVHAKETGSNNEAPNALPYYGYADYSLAKGGPESVEVEETNKEEFLEAFKEEINQPEEKPHVFAPNYGETAPITASYNPLMDASTITPVRNQTIQDCWAFATIGAIEGNLIKNNLATNSIDLSEYHLVYFCTHSAPDPIGVSGNDITDYDAIDYKVAKEDGVNCFGDTGGSWKWSASALMNWKGVASESKYVNPKDASHATNYHIPPDDAFNSLYRVKDVFALSSLDKWDLETKSYMIKSMITKYGSLAVNMYANPSDNPEAGITNYYRAFPNGTCSYNSGSNKNAFDNKLFGINHYVTLVGWDDNYPVENFNKKPSKPGAWIMKNSWGTESGIGGYTYVSYEDTVFASDAVAFICDTTEGYDNNYFHTNLSCDGDQLVQGTDFVEIYEIQKEEELINAISFATDSTKNAFDVKLYKLNGEVNQENPLESGELLISQHEVTAMKGYHTVEFDKNAYQNGFDGIVRKGDKIAIAISFDRPTKVPVCGCHNSVYGEKRICDIQNGCSFVYTSDDFDYTNEQDGAVTRWVDLTNCSIKDWKFDPVKVEWVQNPDGSWATCGKNISGNLRINLLTDDLSICQTIYKDADGNVIDVNKLEKGTCASTLADYENQNVSYTTVENGQEVPYDFSKPVMQDIVITVNVK